MNKQLFHFILSVCICISFSVTAQNDNTFSNYVNIESKGKIPSTFTESTQSKIEKDRLKDHDGMTEKEETIFLKNIHYGIDELLSSGLVLFGDETSTYVQDVADNLLKNDKKLRKQLQFFVLKSNVTNALSTDQGIIFVTLGLLSQLENEAQLAYVLSHEIAHFTEHHVEESFEERMRNSDDVSYDDRIKRLSSYSKDNELEADKKGVRMYYEAGYSESELLATFDVLTYSYLPFDEIRIPKDYFNNEFVFLPEKYFPKEINEIKVDENYDDSKSSHPNIRKRKNAIIRELENYSNWKNNIFNLPEERFYKVRNIARFESVRLDILNHKFGKALYSIFVLERNFPDNVYLHRLKAQSWLGLADFKMHSNYSKTLSTPSKVEGESHAMHYVLKKLSKIQLLTMAIRNIEDVKKAFPEDEVIELIHSRIITSVAGYSKFDIYDYSELTYEENLAAFEKSKIELKEARINDSIQKAEKIEVEQGEELSKYDRIRKKRKGNTAVAIDEEFDVSKFYLYALSDLVVDETFKKRLKEEQRRLEEEEVVEEELYNEPTSAREFVLLDPSIHSTRNGYETKEKSIEIETLLVEVMNEYADEFGLTINNMNKSSVEELTTTEYNKKAVLQDMLRQSAEYDGVEMISVDYLKIEELKKEFGSAKLMFVFGNYRAYPVRPGMAIFGILFPPVGIPYFLSKMMNGNKMVVVATIIDFESGQIDDVIEYDFNQKPKKFIIDGVVYKIFSILTGEKK